MNNFDVYRRDRCKIYEFVFYNKMFFIYMYDCVK